MSRRERYTLYVKRMSSFGRQYAHSKSGLFGLVVFTVFVLLATLAPVVAPHDPSPLNRVAPPFSAPAWVAPLDPESFPTQHLIEMQTFEGGSSSWEFFASDPTLATFELEQDGSEGPGSLKMTFADSDTVRAGKEYAYVSKEIEWAFDVIPPDVLYDITTKFALEGNYTRTDFKVYIAIAPENYQREALLLESLEEGWPILPTAFREFGLVVHEIVSKAADWSPLRKHVGFFQTRLLFDEPGKLEFRVVMELTRGGVKTGVVRGQIDDLQLIAFSEYFGVLGTSDSGADVLSQIIHGSRVSLTVGVVATGIAVGVGVLVGLVAGYYRGVVDEILMRITDFLLILPTLPLLLVLAIVVGRSMWSIIFVIAVLGWVTTARLIRSQTLSEREKMYVEAARAAGASSSYILLRHVLPNVLPIVFVQLTLGVSGAIQAEAALSFLGLGPTEMSWGRMLQDAFERAALSNGAWWHVVTPGLCIALLSISFLFIGYTTNRILNPRLRRR